MERHREEVQDEAFQHGQAISAIIASWMIQFMMWQAKDPEQVPLTAQSEHHARCFQLLQQMMQLLNCCEFDDAVQHEILEVQIYYRRMLLESKMVHLVLLENETCEMAQRRIHKELARMYAELSVALCQRDWQDEWRIVAFTSLKHSARCATSSELLRIQSYLESSLELEFLQHEDQMLRVQVRQLVERIRFYAKHKELDPSLAKLNMALLECSLLSQKAHESDTGPCFDFVRSEIEEMCHDDFFLSLESSAQECCPACFRQLIEKENRPIE